MHERINLPGETIQITLQGLRRIVVEGIPQMDPFPIAAIKPATVPVMRELAADKHRVTNVLSKCNFLARGEEVNPAFLAAFPGAPDPDSLWTAVSAGRVGAARQRQLRLGAPMAELAVHLGEPQLTQSRCLELLHQLSHSLVHAFLARLGDATITLAASVSATSASRSWPSTSRRSSRKPASSRRATAASA